jgi:hypothetical protein
MNQIDQLIRSLRDDTPADDDAENKALHAARRVLHAAIAAEHMGRSRSTEGRLRRLAESSRRIGRSAHSRRGRAVALFAALVIVGVAVPAFGVVGDGWIGGGEIEGVRGSADPKLTGPPVVVASGEPEQPWKIVIARSDQGLCLNVEVGDGRFSSEKHRLGDCGYSDIRGDLPPDVRGDPSAACIGAAALVPCGSRPEYWVQVRSSSFVPEIARIIVVGAAAAEVASVELILTNGKTLHTDVVERPLGPDIPLNVYWAELGPEHGLRVLRNANGQLMPCADEVVEMFVARDSAGRVLGRRVPAWNANPSGDPDGPRRPPDTEECV